MGDFENAKPWDTKGIVGALRFLDRVWLGVHDVVHRKLDSTPPELVRALHRCIRKVSADIEGFKFNTAISAMMILMNEWQRLGGGDRAFAETFLKLLCPFAPHLAEDLWQLLGNGRSIFLSAWPVADESLLVEAEADIAVQINGKVRDRIRVAAGLSEDDLKAAALASDKIKRQLEGKTIKQVVVVPNRLVSIVIQ